MKWLKPVLIVVVLAAALYFAYNSFEASFNPRRGQEGKSGKHDMPAVSEETKQKMRETNEQKRLADKKAASKTPDAKTDPKATNPGDDTKDRR